MRAGELNNQIIIQSKSVTYDSYHAPIETWSTLITVWAKVETTGGGELYAAQKLNATVTAVFTTYYTDLITTLNRIKWGTRTFEILSANDPDGSRVKLLINAKEVV